MTDEELIKSLRGWRMIEMDDAADRIEQLVKETDETHQEAMATIEMWGAARKGQLKAEDKLAKALELLKKAQTYITDLEEHEGAEGFSDSTGALGETYYASLAELEKTE